MASEAPVFADPAAVSTAVPSMPASEQAAGNSARRGRNLILKGMSDSLPDSALRQLEQLDHSIVEKRNALVQTEFVLSAIGIG
jgi:hypothetical protein